jgi:hypothetical protein
MYSLDKRVDSGWVWWNTPVISPLGRLRQDHKFEADLGYIVKPCLKNPKQRLDYGE